MKLKTPILIINFKTYEQSTADNALKLAKICDEVAKETGASIAIAVQPTDIKEIVQNVSIPVLAQHIDGVKYGSNTGHILPESVKEAGVVGSLLNHSEDQYDMTNLKKTIERMDELSLSKILCANTPEKAGELQSLNPDFIAIEPPELIGGPVSVANAKPEVITDTVNIVTSCPVLCGAGVNSKEDVEIALKLGAKGVLVASGIVKSQDPKAAILNLIEGFNQQ